MSETVQVKLTTKTSKGTLIRSPATLEYDKGRIFFLKSPFSLKDEIKAMAGSRWHGYDEENPRKIWSVKDCPRNRFQLAFLTGEDVYAWFDRDLIEHEFAPLYKNGVLRQPMAQQLDMANAALTYHYQIFGAEMGCVDGEAKVKVHHAPAGAVQNYTLEALHTQFASWQKPAYTLSFTGQDWVVNQIMDVIDKGVKPVVKIMFRSSASLIVTPDHEVYRQNGLLCPAALLARGDVVRTNPGVDIVQEVVDIGERRVFDLVMADPHRNFLADGVLVANCGKTLSAQMAIQKAGVQHVWWIGPRTSLPNMRREFAAWGFDFTQCEITWMTYDGCTTRMDNWKPGDFVPRFVVFDESSRLKGETSQRTLAAQMLANLVREKYGFDGYVIEMSGTPSPKSPCDWWAQAEIAWPGFLKEGSRKQLELRMAYMTEESFDAGVFKRRHGWKDDSRKCKTCGEYEEIGEHRFELDGENANYHEFAPSTNEVALLYERLQGLARIWYLKDCADLPEKRYRRVICKPSKSLIRAASVLMQAAPNTITGLTWVRELSDGFQYKNTTEGTTPCGHCPGAQGRIEEWFDREDTTRTYKAVDMLNPEVLGRLEKHEVECPQCKGTGEVPKKVRVVREIPCPKEVAIKLDLERCEETGRIVIFAGFTGSIDRCAKACRSEGWTVVRCDGRGWEISTVNSQGTLEVSNVTGDDALAHWANLNNPRVAFVAHPESGGQSLTLTESRMTIFWSNSFKAEFRAQAEARCHRLGMDNRGCEIVDYIHLPSDERILDVLRENRRLELMTMGDFAFDADGNCLTAGIVADEDITIDELVC